MRLIDGYALYRDIKDSRDLLPHERIEFMKMVRNAPTIEAEPIRYGKWKLHDDGSGTCDQCHHRQKNVWDDDNYQNYCGVCGAKMDLEE